MMVWESSGTPFSLRPYFPPSHKFSFSPWYLAKPCHFLPSTQFYSYFCTGAPRLLVSFEVSCDSRIFKPHLCLDRKLVLVQAFSWCENVHAMNVQDLGGDLVWNVLYNTNILLLWLTAWTPAGKKQMHVCIRRHFNTETHNRQIIITLKIIRLVHTLFHQCLICIFPTS